MTASSTRSPSAYRRHRSEYLEPIIAVAADEGKTVRVPRDPDEGILSGALQEEFDGFSGAVGRPRRATRPRTCREADARRLVVSSPALIISAHSSPCRAAIRVRDGSPVLFRADTRGVARTAVHDVQVPDNGARRGGAASKPGSPQRDQGTGLQDHQDPRVTTLGAFLRAPASTSCPS